MRTSDPARLHSKILIGCILLQAAVALTFALTLRYEFKTSGLDGTVYEQLFSNLLHGRGFVSSVNPPYLPQHWMGIHFSPILFLLVPFYWLFPHIETLLVIGAAALALAAWPIYLAARHILRDSGQALIIAIFYLINPFVFNAIVWDFHEVDFAPLIIAWALWAVVTKKRYTLLALCAALLTVKEHYGLSVAGFGALWALQWRERKMGIWIALDALALMFMLFALVIPYFNPLGKPMMMNADLPLDRFSWLTSWEAIAANALPMLASGATYAAHLLVPFLLLPLVAWAWLLPGIADIAVNMLAYTPMMRSPLSYHSAALIPVILIALCVAIRKLFHGRTRIKANDAMLPLVVVMVSYSYLQLALPFSGPGNIWEFTTPRISYAPEDANALATIHTLIPADAAVSGQYNILPHIPPRFDMYPFPEKLADVSYVVLQLHFPYQHSLNIFGTPYGTSGGRFLGMAEAILTNRDWSVTWAEGRWVVLQKQAKDNADARKTAMEALARVREDYAKAYENVMGVRPEL